MNKPDLISKVSEITGLTKKDTTSVVEATFDVIAKALEDGDIVKLQQFGNFETRPRSARKGRNPQTGDEVEIPAHKVPIWKPAKNVKESVK
jgi:DNA-binding protein HU-beta